MAALATLTSGATAARPAAAAIAAGRVRVGAWYFSGVSEVDVKQPSDPASDSASDEAGGANGSRSTFRRVVGFVARHPAGLVQSLLAVLLAIVVLQNVEPTSVDVLFWSFPAFPKLVLILVSMLVGAIAWELLRRWFRR